MVDVDLALRLHVHIWEFPKIRDRFYNKDPTNIVTNI